MTHTGLESIEIGFKGIKDVHVVTKTDDHELKDYVPFIELLKWGPFTPENMKTLQSEKGMIILGAGCDDCPCVNKITFSEGRKEGMKTITKLYVTPIDQARETAALTEWVNDLKRRLAE